MTRGDDDAARLTAQRDAIIAEHGPWIAANLHVGHGVYTMGHENIGTTEIMAYTLTQAVSDAVGKPLSQVRVLDLASGEGGYAIELGLQGATVLGIEGRAANLAKARFAAESLGLSNVSFEEGDVREISADTLGGFDVVLCLGILYHLEASDAVRLVRSCYEVTERLVVFRTALGLSVDFDMDVEGYRYRGFRYRENTEQSHAAVRNTVSVFPTRQALLNLLADVGFSSVSEIRNPVMPAADDFLDSIVLMAFRGEQLDFRSVPGIDAGLRRLRRPQRRGPAWIWKVAHPQQGLYGRVRERLFRTVQRTVWQSHRSIDEWVSRNQP